VTRPLKTILALACVACATVPPPPPPKPASELVSTRVLAGVDWEREGTTAFHDLAGYLKVPTVNPPGDELPGAQYLAALLAQDGIESEIDPLPNSENRANLYARLKGDGTGGGAICLTSHIDVVPAEPARWPKGKGPFDGTIAVDDDAGGKGGEAVWGRGALDMKVLGLLEVELMRLLKRSNVTLTRDLVLVAVADEEVAGLGMRRVVEERWSDINCTHSINEGGLALKDGLFPGQTAFAISVGEKGVLWLKMKATGSPGHGSTPVPGARPSA
jgi:acetylornithine deacetylase/succinyl-diaminopimelate desuccinylase-like protein